MGRVTDQQVRKLREEMARHGRAEVASLRAGMHRNTARKYLNAAKLPSELRQPRDWRTRVDPFAEDWKAIAERLADAPELEAKHLFWDLMRLRPGVYQEGQLRTFQRRVQVWQAQHGPDKEVFFPQEHIPGEAMQTDFTWATELAITIQGEAFPHMLCHMVLPWSNWNYATVSQSESMLALRNGMAAALIQLGRVPRFHQTDNSTAATHRIAGRDSDEEASEKELTGDCYGRKTREFNAEYLAVVRHYGMEPRTIGIGQSNQNGDVEASNNALKRRLKQHLLMRGNRDFPSVEAYEGWIQDICRVVNGRRQRVEEELAAMTALRVEAFTAFDEIQTKVTEESVLVVKRNTYSVQPRLIGQRVRVRIYEMRLEVWHAGRRVLELPRLLGKNNCRIDYRHIIDALLRKTGAFARYRHREALFPSPVWHQALENLEKALGPRKGEVDYLRLLHLAASTLECDVEAALILLMEAGEVPEVDRVKALMGLHKPAEVPAIAPLQVDLGEFDGLLSALLAGGSMSANEVSGSAHGARYMEAV
jgi:hypothetical protein